ncbi:hypothetical protein B296_00052787 [Ensete ventricosum]|uniref:Uncharacterized protein n=1 Tax=Ensete ventricosum TaxID=4639 RepID=A0A426XMT5_ENSVE|nr:hypothetical protein B296_00052787 [Ensete ventricosum]
MHSVGLVDAHPPEVRPKALKFVANMGDLERIRVSNAPTVVVSVCSSSESSLVREAVERLVSDLASNGRCRSSMPLVDSASAGCFSSRWLLLQQLWYVKFPIKVFSGFVSDKEAIHKGEGVEFRWRSPWN